MPLELEETKSFILRTWPRAGYRLGRGDSEPGLEFEDNFKKDRIAGLFIGYPHCNRAKTVLQLILNDEGLLLPVGSRGTPIR